MALEITGEVLSVTTETVQAGERDGRKWDAFESTTIMLFDEGHVSYVRVGRDFPVTQITQLRREADKRPLARIACYLAKGRIVGTKLLALDLPAEAQAS